MSRLQTYYKENVVPELTKQFNYANIMQVPKITKITLNMGVGEAVGDKKVMERAVGDMTAIAGQKPVVRLARKSVASFKIRDGWPASGAGGSTQMAPVPRRRSVRGAIPPASPWDRRLPISGQHAITGEWLCM